MEYHKIETIFKRDMEGNKKLIEGEFRSPAIECLKNIVWEFTEKVDGTNVRVIWDGHKVSFNGRTENSQMPIPLLEELNRLFGGNTNEEIFEQLFGEKQAVLYGEGYGGKIQGGGAYRKSQSFILFDILIGDYFLERENLEEIAKAFNISIVPIVLSGTIQEAIDYVRINPKSIIAETDKEMEGLVGKTQVPLFDKFGNRMIVKIKYEDFK
jgi:hypothetical protein